MGNVWESYVAISAMIHDLFSKNLQEYPIKVQEAIQQIVNSHFKEIMDVKGGIIYLAGFFLDPGK